MAMKREDLLQHIEEAFPDATVELVDLAGDNDHWSVTITSSAFNGLSRVARHRLVNKALDGKLGDQLHALQIKTLAEGE